MAEAKDYSYKGSCHCGANAFTVSFDKPLNPPEGKSLSDDPPVVETIYNCNCSICEINGYLLAMTSPKRMDFSSGSMEEMTRYVFKNKKEPILEHRFCPECGTSVGGLFVAGQLAGTLVVNVRALKDVDIQKLKLLPYDGKHLF